MHQANTMKSHPVRSLFLLATTLSALVIMLLLVACSQQPSQPWVLTNIRGHMPDLAFHLTNDKGRAVIGADYRGKIVLLYFGYTHCPDVCPLTLAKLSAALHTLGKQAREVRILFVSVDPQRDTPKVLHTYVQAFSPQMVGLTGSQQQIEDITKRYRVVYTYGKPEASGNYVVTHSAAIYIFDGHGQVRLLGTQTDPMNDFVHDLRLLLKDPENL